MDCVKRWYEKLFPPRQFACHLNWNTVNVVLQVNVGLVWQVGQPSHSHEDSNPMYGKKQLDHMETDLGQWQCTYLPYVTSNLSLMTSAGGMLVTFLSCVVVSFIKVCLPHLQKLPAVCHIWQ
jgi:hypothetical protein